MNRHPKIIPALGIRASSIFALDATVPNYDTTSTNVWGDYRDCALEKPPSLVRSSPTGTARSVCRISSSL